MRAKEAVLGVNEKFIRVLTCSYSGWITDDPFGEDIYLDLFVDFRDIGESVLRALAKSRDVSISEEDRKALIDGKVTREWIDEKYPEGKIFDPEPCERRYKEWLQYAMKQYKYKTKKALMQNLQNVSIQQDAECIIFNPTNHESIEGYGAVPKELKLIISPDSSLEIIGAAAKYAIGNCRGKGADFMRNLLFPEGQPDTFEKYTEMLGI